MTKLFCVKTSSLRDAWLGSSPRMSIWTSYYWFQKKKFWQTFFTFTESMSLKFWSRPSVFILFYIIFVNFVILTFILTFKHSTTAVHILWMWEIKNDPERSIEKVSETFTAERLLRFLLWIIRFPVHAPTKYSAKLGVLTSSHLSQWP